MIKRDQLDSAEKRDTIRIDEKRESSKDPKLAEAQIVIEKAIMSLRNEVAGMQEERKKKEDILLAIEKTREEKKAEAHIFSTRKY